MRTNFDMETRRFNNVAVGLALSIFASSVQAQNNNNDNGNNGGQQAQGAAATTKASANQLAAATQANSNGNGNGNANQNLDLAAAETTPVDQGQSAAITGVPTATTQTTAAGAAQTGVSTFTGLSNLPSLAGATIPTAVVPYTDDAPFMQKSSLPEGTVFICVGALLGFMLLSVLAWRATGFWLIHRSVRRANERMALGDIKSAYTGSGGKNSSKKLTKYTSLAAPSTLSLDHLNFAAPTGSAGTGSTKRNTSRQTFMSTNSAARNSSLFFSPTATPPSHSVGMMSPTNRSSSYLPSGYYAAAGATAAGGASTLQVGSGSRQSSGMRQPSGLSNLGRYSAYASGSPPDSPAMPPSRPGTGSRPSSGYSGIPQNRPSMLNLHAAGTAQGGGRVPSANLDNFLEGGSFLAERR